MSQFDFVQTRSERSEGLERDPSVTPLLGIDVRLNQRRRIDLATNFDLLRNTAK